MYPTTRPFRRNPALRDLTPSALVALVLAEMPDPFRSALEPYADDLGKLAAEALSEERRRRRAARIDAQRAQEANRGRQVDRAGEPVDDFASVEEAKAAIVAMAQDLADLPPPDPKYKDDVGFSVATDTALRNFLGLVEGGVTLPDTDYLRAARLLILHSKTQLPRPRVLGAVRALEAALPQVEPLPSRPSGPTQADFAIVDPRSGEGRDAGVGAVGWEWKPGSQKVRVQIPANLMGRVRSEMAARGHALTPVRVGETTRYDVPLGSTRALAGWLAENGSVQGSQRFRSAADTWEAEAVRLGVNATPTTTAAAPAPSPSSLAAGPSSPVNVPDLSAGPPVTATAPAPSPVPGKVQPIDLAEGYAAKNERFFSDYVRWFWSGGDTVQLAFGMIGEGQARSVESMDFSDVRRNGWKGRGSWGGRGGGGDQPKSSWVPASRTLQAILRRMGVAVPEGSVTRPKLDGSSFQDYFTAYPIADLPLIAAIAQALYKGDTVASDALRERAPWWAALAKREPASPSTGASPASPTSTPEARARKGSSGEIRWQYDPALNAVELQTPYFERKVSLPDPSRPGATEEIAVRGVFSLLRHQRIPHFRGGDDGYSIFLRPVHARRLFDALATAGLYVHALPTLREQLPYWQALENENAPKASKTEIQEATHLLRRLRFQMDPAVAESLMADLPSTAYYLSRVKPGARQGNAGVYGRWDTKVEVVEGGRKGPELKGEIRLYVDGLGPGVDALSSGLTQVSAKPKNYAHRFALTQAGELADALDRVGYAPLALTIRGALLADDPRAGCTVQKVLADAHSLEEVTDPEARALIADTVARYTPRVKPGIKVRDYQAIGASYARANKYRAIIGDEMGIGKTFQAILALASASDELCPALIVAPASVVGKWGKEIDKFVTGIRYRIVQAGSAKGQSVPVQVAEALRDRAWDVLILGWSTLQDKDAADLLIEAAQNGRIKTVVYDEIHYAKNPGAARTKAAMKIAHAVKGGRLFLSGTLIENDASEAWAPLNMLNPVEYDSAAEFSDRFGGTGGSSRAFYQTDPATGERVRVKVKVKARVTDPDKIQLAKLEELRVALRCDMVRRMKADVMPELPPAVRVFETVEIKPNDRKAYDEAVDLLPGWIVAQVRYQIARKAGERMKIAAQAGRDLSPHDAVLEVLSSAQAVSDDPKAKPPEPIRDAYGSEARKAAYELMRTNLLTAYGYFRRFIGEAKAEDVAAVVLDYLQSSTKPTVVFAEHQKVLDYLGSVFEKAGKRTARIDGTVTGGKRDAIVADFQAGKYDVLIGSQAIKEGVDLTRADDSFFAEQWTNPSRIAQAEARIHRADEFTLAKKASTYHHLYAPETIDEDILALLAAKQAILGAVLGREQVKAGALSVERTGFLGGALGRLEGDPQAAAEAIPTDAQVRAAERGALRAPKLKIGHIEIDGADYPSVGRFRKSGSASARGTATDAEDLILSEQVEDVLP